MGSGSDILAVAAARNFRKSTREIERGADCFFGVIFQCAGKSKDRNDSFAVGRVQIRASIAQQFGRTSGKFFTRRCHHTEVVVIREVVFVGQIANHHTGLEGPSRAIEFNFA